MTYKYLRGSAVFQIAKIQKPLTDQCWHLQQQNPTFFAPSSAGPSLHTLSTLQILHTPNVTDWCLGLQQPFWISPASPDAGPPQTQQPYHAHVGRFARYALLLSHTNIPSPKHLTGSYDVSCDNKFGLDGVSHFHLMISPDIFDSTMATKQENWSRCVLSIHFCSSLAKLTNLWYVIHGQKCVWKPLKTSVLVTTPWRRTVHVTLLLSTIFNGLYGLYYNTINVSGNWQSPEIKNVVRLNDTFEYTPSVFAYIPTSQSHSICASLDRCLKLTDGSSRILTEFPVIFDKLAKLYVCNLLNATLPVRHLFPRRQSRWIFGVPRNTRKFTWGRTSLLPGSTPWLFIIAPVNMHFPSKREPSTKSGKLQHLCWN